MTITITSSIRVKPRCCFILRNPTFPLKIVEAALQYRYPDLLITLLLNVNSFTFDSKSEGQQEGALSLASHTFLAPQFR